MDESHKVSTPGAGHWRYLERIKKDRPQLRFWLLALLGTILHSSPKDIAAPISIMSSPAWEEEEHPMYHMRVKALMDAAALLTTIETDEEAQTSLNDFNDKFKTLLPRVLVRRNENSTWFGMALLELKDLYKILVDIEFPR